MRIFWSRYFTLFTIYIYSPMLTNTVPGLLSEVLVTRPPLGQVAGLRHVAARRSLQTQAEVP